MVETTRNAAPVDYTVSDYDLAAKIMSRLGCGVHGVRNELHCAWVAREIRRHRECAAASSPSQEPRAFMPPVIGLVLKIFDLEIEHQQAHLLDALNRSDPEGVRTHENLLIDLRARRYQTSASFQTQTRGADHG